MTLTNQSGIQAQENVQTDIRLGENKVLPTGRILSPEAQILMNKSIIAKSLGVPAQEEIEILNHSYAYRWVNRTGMGGILYAQRKSQGFTNATTQDVSPKSVDITTDNGEIRSFDVILMKIPVEKYQAALKHNMLKAMRLQNMRGAYIDGGIDPATGKPLIPSTDVMADANPSLKSVSTETAKGMTAFIPSEEELNQKMPTPKKRGE